MLRMNRGFPGSPTLQASLLAAEGQRAKESAKVCAGGLD